LAFETQRQANFSQKVETLKLGAIEAFCAIRAAQLASCATIRFRTLTLYWIYSHEKFTTLLV